MIKLAFIDLMLCAKHLPCTIAFTPPSTFLKRWNCDLHLDLSASGAHPQNCCSILQLWHISCLVETDHYPPLTELTLASKLLQIDRYISSWFWNEKKKKRTLRLWNTKLQLTTQPCVIKFGLCCLFHSWRWVLLLPRTDSDPLARKLREVF